MKLDARRVDAFLRDPGTCRVVLLFGDDLGLIRERGDALVRAVAGSLDDPFRVGEIERDAVARLPAEAASLPLGGGRYVVRLRDATDAAVAPVKAVLDGAGEALVVLEGPTLAARSRLRTALEAAAAGVAIACYREEGRALEATIRTNLAAHDVSVEPDAVAWLSGQLGADRAMTVQELGKLALWAGTGGTVDLAAAAACVGDAAALSLDDALFAATAGQIAAMDRALQTSFAEGGAAAGAVRAALLHFQRLHRARIAVDDGAPVEQAARAARPPVFWRREAAFKQAIGLWDAPSLTRGMAALATAERESRRTGAPTETICREVFASLARYAASRARGSRAAR